MRRAPAHALAVSCASFALGCLTPEPILYPNETLQSNGETQVDLDLEECSKLAEKYKAGASRVGEVASTTAEDVVVGGAAGAAGGAVYGNAGTGAAAGAAGGAAAGIVRGIFRTHRDPDPNYRLFVERCLERKGYEVVGWE